MKIAIIADSHDNIVNIEKFIAWAKKNKIDLIIHCGDLAAPSIISKEFGPKFKKPFYFIHGNVADRELSEKFAKKFKKLSKNSKSCKKIQKVAKKFKNFRFPAHELAFIKFNLKDFLTNIIN